MKDFNKWNNVKIKTDSCNKRKRYHAGDIWWCSIGENVGYEQSGAGDLFERPVLVLKGFSRQVCLIIPLTTKTKNNKFHYCIDSINGKNNFAILSQIKLVDVKRFVNQIGFFKRRNFK